MTCSRNSSGFVDCLLSWVFFFWCLWIFEFQLFVMRFKGVKGHRLEVRNWSHIPSVKSLTVLCTGMQCVYP